MCYVCMYYAYKCMYRYTHEPLMAAVYSCDRHLMLPVSSENLNNSSCLTVNDRVILRNAPFLVAKKLFEILAGSDTGMYCTSFCTFIIVSCTSRQKPSSYIVVYADSKSCSFTHFKVVNTEAISLYVIMFDTLFLLFTLDTIWNVLVSYIH